MSIVFASTNRLKWAHIKTQFQGKCSLFMKGSVFWEQSDFTVRKNCNPLTYITSYFFTQTTIYFKFWVWLLLFLYEPEEYIYSQQNPLFPYFLQNATHRAILYIGVAYEMLTHEHVWKIIYLIIECYKAYWSWRRISWETSSVKHIQYDRHFAVQLVGDFNTCAVQ